MLILFLPLWPKEAIESNAPHDGKEPIHPFLLFVFIKMDDFAPGADDNASGTAAVIEAARIFSNYSFPFTIVYVLFDEEEQGLVGSNYFATQARNQGEDIIAVINLDMIPWDSNNDNVAEIHTRPIVYSVALR